MTTYSVPRRKSTATITSPDPTSSVRDPLSAAFPDGAVRFRFDLDWDYGYPKQAAPAYPNANELIRDLSGRADGSYVHNTSFESPRPTFTAGGLNMTPVTQMPFGVKAPSDAWDAIFDDGQNFLWLGYYKLPSETDWKPSSGFAPLFDTTPNNGFYISNPDPLAVTPITISGTKLLRFARQTAVGAIVSTDLPPSSLYGQFAQIAYWRTAEGYQQQARVAAGTVSLAGARGADNTADPSGIAPVWGRAGGSNQSMNAEDQAATNYTVFGGALVNLDGVDVDISAVLDADWDRMMARKAASGDTIFV